MGLDKLLRKQIGPDEESGTKRAHLLWSHVVFSAGGEAVNGLPFDASKHPSAQTDIAKKMIERLDNDTKAFAAMKAR